MKTYKKIISLVLCIVLLLGYITPSLPVSAGETLEKQTGELGKLGTTTGSTTGLTYKDTFTEDWEGGLDLNKWSVEKLEDDFKSDFQVVDDPLGGKNEDGTPNQVMTYTYFQTWLVPTDDYWPTNGFTAGEIKEVKMRIYMKDFDNIIRSPGVQANQQPGMVWSYIATDKMSGYQFASGKENSDVTGLVAGQTVWNEIETNRKLGWWEINNGYWGANFDTTDWFDVTITVSGGKVVFTAEDKNGVVCNSRTDEVLTAGGRFAVGNRRFRYNNYNRQQTNGVMYIDDIEVTFSQSTVDTDDVQKDVTAYYAGSTFLEPGDTLNITGEDLGATVISAQIKKIDLEKSTDISKALCVNENTYYESNSLNVAWEDIPYEEGSLITDFKIEQRSETGLKMILPDGSVSGQEMYAERGSYAVLLEAAAEDGKDAVIIVNNPQISILLQDDGDYATSDGWIKLSGYNLSVQNDHTKVSAIIIDSQGNKTFVDNSKIEVDTTENNGESNDYYMMIHLEDYAPGDYQVMVHNGFGGDYGWSMPFDFTVKEKAENEIWRDMGVFNVQDYGAKGDGEANDTAAIQSAINTAVENGGGMVYFPRQKNGENAGYRITNPLIVGENISLVGDGISFSFLFYDGFLEKEMLEYIISFERNLEIADLQISCQTNPFKNVIKKDKTKNLDPGKIYFNEAKILIDTTGAISDSIGTTMEGYTDASAYSYLTDLWTGTHQYFVNQSDVKETYFQLVDSEIYIQPRLSNKAAHLFLWADYLYFNGYDEGEGVNTWSYPQCDIAGFFENGSIGKFVGLTHYRNIENGDNTNNNREIFLTDGGVQGYGIRMQPLINSYSDEEYQIILEEELGKLDTEAKKTTLISQVKTYVDAHPGQVYRFLNYVPKNGNEYGYLFVVAGQGTGQVREMTNLTKIGSYVYFTIEEPFAVTPNRSSTIAHSTIPKFKTIVNNADFWNGSLVGPYGYFVDVTFDKVTMRESFSGISFITAYKGFMWYCTAKNITATEIGLMRTDNMQSGSSAGTQSKSDMSALQFLGIRYCDSYIGENGGINVALGGTNLPVTTSDVVYENIEIFSEEPAVYIQSDYRMQGIWLRNIVQYTEENNEYSRISPYDTYSLKYIKNCLQTDVYGTTAFWCDSVDASVTRRRGDINNDDMITLKDVTLLRQLLGEEKSAEELDEAYGKNTATVYADMNSDGVVDARDIYAIRNYVRTGEVGDVGKSEGGSGSSGDSETGDESSTIIKDVEIYDDFEDANQSQVLWNSINTSNIVTDEATGNNYWYSEKADGRVVTSAVEMEDGKPTAVSFDVLPKTANKSAKLEGLALYFLHSDAAYTAMGVDMYADKSANYANLVLVTDDDVNTNATSETHTAINSTGFTLTKVAGDSVWRSGSAYGHWMQWNKLDVADGYIRIIASYDWSRWNSDGIVSIKYQISDADGKDADGNALDTTYTWTYEYTYFGTAESKPESFTVGFGAATDGAGSIDNVGIALNMTDEQKAEIFVKTYKDAITANEVTAKNAADIVAAYDGYQKLSTEIKAVLADYAVDSVKYNVGEVLKTNYDLAVNMEAGDGTYDNFNDSVLSATLWNNLDTSNLLTDTTSGNGYWYSETADSKVITPTVEIKDGKPTAVSFDVLPQTANKNATLDGIALYFLYSEAAYTAMGVDMYADKDVNYANLVLVSDTDVNASAKSENHTEKVNATGFTLSKISGAAPWRSGSSYGHWLQYNKLDVADGYIRIAAAYDWSKWDSDGIVGITYTISDADGLDAEGNALNTTYTWTYEYTYFGDESLKPDNFTVGFHAATDGAGSVDNVFCE